MDARDSTKIIRVVFFLIPLIIMLILSTFVGKTKAVAHYFRFKSTIRLILFSIFFISIFSWTVYVILFDKKDEDRKYIKTDLFVTLIFFIILVFVFLYWRWTMSLSNNKASGMQYLNTTLNGIRTTRNMFR